MLVLPGWMHYLSPAVEFPQRFLKSVIDVLGAKERGDIEWLNSLKRQKECERKKERGFDQFEFIVMHM